jgi:hypothetical protein
VERGILETAVRVGDSITVGHAEAELLKGPSFARVAPPGLPTKIELLDTGRGDYQLALPGVGREVVEALTVIAERGGASREAIAAETLATAIKQRLAA